MNNQEEQNQSQDFANSSAGAESSKVSKKPRKTAEEREKELRTKMERMQQRLNKIEEDKKAEQLKKVDGIVKRVRAKIVALGLKDVPPDEFEILIESSADALRAKSVSVE